MSQEQSPKEPSYDASSSSINKSSFSKPKSKIDVKYLN